MNKNNPNKTVAYNGAIIAIAAVFGYSIIMMIYTLIRSSATIYCIMPTGHRTTILLNNAFSVAYSVLIFSLLMAAISSIAGAIAAIILRKLLLYFNPLYDFKKALLINFFTAVAMLILMYLLFYALLKDWMTFDYAETFLFWFLFPAAIFMAVCITGAGKLNHVLRSGSNTN